jgi:hypothetical protein
MPRRGVIWSTGSIAHRKQVPTRRAFLDWHRAHLLGLKVEKCEFEGLELDGPALFRLNCWVMGLGAWRCSLLPSHEAHQILRKVILGGVHRIPVGRSGAGRWASGTRAASILGLDLSEGREKQLWFDLRQDTESNGG